MITLNNGYTIDTKGAGVTLKFSEIRQKEELIDKKKTGKMVDYTFTDEWHYLDISDALRRYLNLSLEDSADFKDLMSALERVEKSINEIIITN